MKSLTHLQAVIPEDIIAQLRQRVEATLYSIYSDYFSKMSFDAFNLSHVVCNTSRVMQLATLRFANLEVLTKLRELLIPHIQHITGESELLLIHPSFFLRLSFPENNDLDKGLSFLNTEPHYDHYMKKSFEIQSFTFWVPFEDIDEESGGLCSFSTPEIFDYFTNQGRMRYNPGTYFKVAPKIDPLLKRSTVAPKIQAGDILTFDSNTLHGATRPRSRRRISFDFRLLPRTSLKGAPAGVHRLFDRINFEFDSYNADNLIELGDFLGASRIL